MAKTHRAAKTRVMAFMPASRVWAARGSGGPLPMFGSGMASRAGDNKTPHAKGRLSGAKGRFYGATDRSGGLTGRGGVGPAASRASGASRANLGGAAGGVRKTMRVPRPGALSMPRA